MKKRTGQGNDPWPTNESHELEEASKASMQRAIMWALEAAGCYPKAEHHAPWEPCNPAMCAVSSPRILGLPELA